MFTKCLKTFGVKYICLSKYFYNFYGYIHETAIYENVVIYCKYHKKFKKTHTYIIAENLFS